LIPEDASFVQVLNPLLASLELPALNIAVSCFQRGLSHLEQSQWDLARLDFERTISLNPHADAYFQRGLAYLKLEDYPNAISDFDKAAMLQPHRAEIYEYRGDTHQGLKSYENALANYNQAIHLGSNSATNRRDQLQSWWTAKKQKANDFYNGGVYHLQQLDYAKAISDFEQAELCGHPEASQMLQTILVSTTSKVDYAELLTHLKKQSWKDADETTKKLILIWQAASRGSSPNFYLHDLPSFPIEDLAIVDGLWTKYSSGQFGFSRQVAIWNEENGNASKFEKRIGWASESGSPNSYGNLKFDLSAPAGHFRGAVWPEPGLPGRSVPVAGCRQRHWRSGR
jgi:tetratricopeptide (TPR) repeat protein